jgi:hypothetical protein
MATNDIWGADTVVSMPAPLNRSGDAIVDMGGFAFTDGGIAHNITRADLEDYLFPTFRPIPTAEVG